MFDLFVDGINMSLERVFERKVPTAVFALVLDAFVNVADVNTLLVRSRELSTADLA